MAASGYLAQLAAAHVNYVLITYSGSGDDGYVEPPEFRDKGDQALLVGPQLSALDDFFTQWTYALLEREVPGWEIEDGSSGSIRLDVPSGKIAWIHTKYYIESNTKAHSLVFEDTLSSDDDDDREPGRLPVEN